MAELRDNYPEAFTPKFEHLNKTDPEVFTHEYCRHVQRSDGRQPVVTTKEGVPLDESIKYKFVGTPVFYRGNYYASINPDKPYIGFQKQVNSNGLYFPGCFKLPNVNHHLVGLLVINGKPIYQGRDILDLYNKQFKAKLLDWINEITLRSEPGQVTERAFIEDEMYLGYSPEYDHFFSIWKADLLDEYNMFNVPSTIAVGFTINDQGQIDEIYDQGGLGTGIYSERGLEWTIKEIKFSVKELGQGTVIDLQPRSTDTAEPQYDLDRDYYDGYDDDGIQDDDRDYDDWGEEDSFG